MTHTYKYVVILRTKDGLSTEMPIIFPQELSHKDVYLGVQGGLWQDFWSTKPVSAGFVDLTCPPRCHGMSETLDIDSRGDVDADLIQNYPITRGVQE